MAVKLTGDFAKLESWAKQVDRLATGKELTALSKNFAEETIDLIAEGFRQEQAPNGKKWKRKKRPDGRQILVGKTARLRRGWHRTQLGPNGFTVSPSVDYATFHQSGTTHMVARPMVPEGRLPERWRLAFEELAVLYLNKYFK